MCDIFFLQRLNQYSNGISEAISDELRLLRTILGRLECSFAKQEAKLDRQEAKLDTLLNMMTAQTPVPQTVQCTPQTTAQPHSFATPIAINSSASSVEFPPPLVVPRQQEMPVNLHLFDVPAQRSALPELTDSPVETGKQYC